MKAKTPAKKAAKRRPGAAEAMAAAEFNAVPSDIGGVGFEPIGQPGFPQYGGFVQDDILRELIGARARNIFREMADNDSTCGALIFAFNTLINACKWDVQPANESPEAAEAADFLRDVLFNDMDSPWGDAVQDAATMLIYGFAVQEIVWKRREKDNRIGVARFASRSQHTIWQWGFDPKTFDVTAVLQQPPSGMQIKIPADRCVLFKTAPARGNPEGRSVLRSAYRAWSMKKRIENIEGIGMERDLAGLPMMLVPAIMLDQSADAQQKAALAGFKTLVKRVRRDSQEGIVLPSTRDQSGNLLYEFKLLSTGGTRSFDTTKVLDRYGKAIAMSTLADFIYLGQGSVGSFALSRDKTELFGVAAAGFVARIQDAYNNSFVPRLWDFNALPPELMPKIKHGEIEQATLGEVTQAISTLISAGGILDHKTENVLRGLAGLPILPEEGMDDIDTPSAHERTLEQREKEDREEFDSEEE